MRLEWQECAHYFYRDVADSIFENIVDGNKNIQHRAFSVPHLLAYNLQTIIRLHRRRRTPNCAANYHAIERKAMILVLQRDTTALLCKNLDIATCCSNLRSRSHRRGQHASKRLENSTFYLFNHCREKTHDVDHNALVLSNVDYFGSSSAAVFWRGLDDVREGRWMFGGCEYLISSSALIWSRVDGHLCRSRTTCGLTRWYS